MRIDPVNDILAPGAVTVVNIMARASTKMIGNTPIADIATYAMAGGGYLAYAMGWGGGANTFVKNVAIASAPLAMEKLYSAFRGTTTASHVTRLSRVSRYPAPAEQSPFNGVRLV